MNSRARYERDTAALAKMRGEIANLEEIRKILEGTRVRLEGALQDLDTVSGEFRGQLTVVKERTAYLIAAVHALEKTIGKTTNPGDST